jgi:hypothetical protein
MPRTLGELVLGFHFAFIVFALLGGLVVLWKSWIAWLHLPSVVWSALVNLFSWVCPLTPLENSFRDLAGQAGYEGGFIQHYIAPVVYPSGMSRSMELIASFSVLIWNVVIYTLVVSLRRRGPLRAATKQSHREAAGESERESTRSPEALRADPRAPGGAGYRGG